MHPSVDTHWWLWDMSYESHSAFLSRIIKNVTLKILSLVIGSSDTSCVFGSRSIFICAYFPCRMGVGRSHWGQEKKENLNQSKLIWFLIVKVFKNLNGSKWNCCNAARNLLKWGLHLSDSSSWRIYYILGYMILMILMMGGVRRVIVRCQMIDSQELSHTDPINWEELDTDLTPHGNTSLRCWSCVRRLHHQKV